MISTPFLICLIGLVLWLIFTKFPKIADAWAAEVGRLLFFAGLLAWLFSVQGKSLF